MLHLSTLYWPCSDSNFLKNKPSSSACLTLLHPYQHPQQAGLLCPSALYTRAKYPCCKYPCCVSCFMFLLPATLEWKEV
uniref:Uncharacterized protein n=1 Tax=Anguilla anguilla TaxID=7936 RepID=A0A0E9X7G1_ANGAN